MKKISYYLIFIVVIGGILVSFWVYQKYFKEEEPGLLLFKVEKGSIQEVVKVRGEVISQKEFDLGFLFSGIVEKIFVKEGDKVNQGDFLMKLETIDFELEIKRLEASLAQNQANLEKLLAGLTPEEIKVAETVVLNTLVTLENAEQNLKDVEVDTKEDLKQAYEDALNTLDDSYLKIYNSFNVVSSIQHIYFTSNDQEGIKVRDNKDELQNILNQARDYINDAKSNFQYEKIDTALSEVKKNLEDVNKSLEIIRNITEVISYRDIVSSTDKTSLDNQRTNITTALTNIVNAQQTISTTGIANEANINSAEAQVSTAEAQLQKAQDELTLKRAGFRQEDIEVARAKIQETESQLAAMKEKIKKSTLYAPGSAKVVKVWLEKQELFKPGQVAVSLSVSGYKIRADVSELEIGKIREIDGNDVLIQLDAFLGQEFKGRVVFIEPKEIIKEGDKYYRINVYLEQQVKSIRSGMSADLIINISYKDNVLKISELTVYEKDDRKFVIILEAGGQKEVEIETGISDGELIEVIKGLKEGQTIVVSAD